MERRIGGEGSGKEPTTPLGAWVKMSSTCGRVGVFGSVSSLHACRCPVHTRVMNGGQKVGHAGMGIFFTGR